MAANVPVWKGYTGLVETPESGQFKLAERVTLQKVYLGKLVDAYNYAQTHPRGTTGVFTMPNSVSGEFFVEDCTVQPERGNKGTVTVNWQYVGLLPPDEHSIVPFEVNPRIERNPYFATLTKDDFSKAKAVFTAASAAGKTQIESAIEGTSNKVLTKALVQKLLEGKEIFYQAGIKYQWSLHSYYAPAATLGGVRQTPGGPLSAFLPAGLSWLRQCDEVNYSNGLYKLTRTWLGGQSGFWDADLYPAG